MSHAATASDDLISGLADRSLLRSFAYIDGRWTAGRGNASFPVTDPATGEVVGHAADLSSAESATAVDAADAAFSA